MFRVIKEPEENPNNLLDSYRKQNIIMQKTRMLHTAFDGIKLNHWSDDDRELPDILAGSICEFEGRLFEANENIKLIDNITVLKEDLRYIKLVIHRDNKDSNNDYLKAETAGGDSKALSGGFPNYDYENRGFYVKDENNIIKEKYLRLSMKYDVNLGGYVEKKYWNINDFQRKGLSLKRKTVSFGAGTHEFDFPSDVNSITLHICSGGGGGSAALMNTTGLHLQERHDSEDGGASQIIINGDQVITSCAGGGKGSINGLSAVYGKGGIPSGEGRLFNGNNAVKNNSTGHGLGAVFINNGSQASGGNGGNGQQQYLLSAGGGSGSAAITAINRGMLGASSKIKIIVGGGGIGAMENWSGHINRGEQGGNGSAFIEYMQK